MKKILLCGIVLTVAGCASNPSDIGAQYVDPAPYLQQSCAQLAHQDQADTQDLASAEKHQRRMHQSDEWGVALIGVPVGSIGGDRHKDIGRLKGELDASMQPNGAKTAWAVTVRPITMVRRRPTLPPLRPGHSLPTQA